tara:strand:- start:6028 stop:6759 length:732 start_codon:yes stop_codon:yes gene_type:complete
MNKLLKALKKIKRRFTGHRSYRKFIVLTRSRTGSNLLISLLNAHQNIEAHGEIFARLHHKTSMEIWNNTFGIKRKWIKRVGFKIFYYHPLDSDDSIVWDQLLKDKSIKVIHLQRENLLRVHLSRLIAGKTDVWTNSGKEKTTSSKNVEVSIDEMFDDFKQTQFLIEKAASDFRSHEFVDIRYETLAANKQAEMTKLFKFLDLPNEKVSSDLKKQNPEKLEDLIINYQEVREALENTEYEHFLD